MLPTTHSARAGCRTNLSEISGHPDDKWGGSVMAALQIKNIPTGAGDDIKVDVSYAKGPTKNVIATSGSSPNFAMFGGSGFGYQSVGFGATTDGVYLPARAAQAASTSRRPGVSAARSITTGIRTGRAACSAATRPSGMTAEPTTTLLAAGTTTAKGAYCAAFAASHPGQALVGSTAGAYTCNPDFNVSQLGVVTRWTPSRT